MDKKRNEKLIFLIILLTIPIFPCVSSNAEYECESFENQYGKLEVCPKTSGNAFIQKQYWNLTAFITAQVDIIFQFDYQLSYGGLFYWNNDLEKHVKMSVDYVFYESKHYYIFNNLNIVDGKNYKGFWEYNTLFNTSGKWNMYVKKSSDPFGSWKIELDPYYNSSYARRYDLYVDNQYIDSTLTDFPVRVHIAGNTELNDNTQSDLDDIIFVDTTNTTLLKYELDNYTKTGGKLFANYWVKIPSVSSSEKTHFNLYYDNDLATNQSDPTNVWDSNYIAIWHLNDMLDSTSNNIDLSNNGASLTTDGKIGKAINIEKDDANSYLYHSTFLDVIPASDELTIETMINSESNDGFDMTIVSKNWITAQDRLIFRKDGTNDYLELFMETQNGGSKLATGSIGMNINTWYYATGVYDSSNALLNFLETTKTTGDTVGEAQDGTTNDFEIGKWYATSDNDFDGIIDEIRISDTVRSDDWIESSRHSIQHDGYDANPFIIWGGYEIYIPDEFVITNVTPPNNSYWCNDVTSLNNISLQINSTLGKNFLVNITFNNVIYFSGNMSNGTYSIDISDIIPFGTTNFTWIVNITCEEQVCFFNGSYNFNVCWEALLYMQITNLNETIGGDLLELDGTQFALMIELTIFCILIWIAFKILTNDEEVHGKNKLWNIVPYSAGLLLLLAGIDFIGMSVTLTAYVNNYMAGYLFFVGAIILVYGIGKAFYYDPDDFT